ncbi:uncharacterized protein TRAVEDRAFT_45204 [Trametes versicolor FP-101664 SS1]|uniref:uncharacterized protein n=1 Tax=Trametes versicolor (strain FP-101664) TaxID=717944 RepID=UPI0004623BBF|nr:uncharacterized protein TRAVEDRAFT_45204 [Trametes versicolor FP-101664 SS1]EIW62384.1 hypothetical protein TRAVEDRAFT_45204 [Trametes versicolor FP-101664 SS1]
MCPQHASSITLRHTPPTSALVLICRNVLALLTPRPVLALLAPRPPVFAHLCSFIHTHVLLVHDVRLAPNHLRLRHCRPARTQPHGFSATLTSSSAPPSAPSSASPFRTIVFRHLRPHLPRACARHIHISRARALACARVLAIAIAVLSYSSTTLRVSPRSANSSTALRATDLCPPCIRPQRFPAFVEFALSASARSALLARPAFARFDRLSFPRTRLPSTHRTLALRAYDLRVRRPPSTSSNHPTHSLAHATSARFALTICSPRAHDPP